MIWKFELYDTEQTEPYHSTYVHGDEWLHIHVKAAIELGRADRIELQRLPNPAGS